MLALCEVLRTFREKVGKEAPEFAVLAGLFQEVEVARMPLAKHEPKGRRGLHYPTTILHREFGWLGWLVFEPKTQTEIQVYRTDLANATPRPSRLAVPLFDNLAEIGALASRADSAEDVVYKAA